MSISPHPAAGPAGASQSLPRAACAQAARGKHWLALGGAEAECDNTDRVGVRGEVMGIGINEDGRCGSMVEMMGKGSCGVGVG
jgi:hypothetical protein